MQKINFSTIKRTLFSLSILGIGSVSLLISGCDQVSRNEEIQPGRTNVTSEEVANLSENPEQLIGQEVTIRNPVETVVDPNGFVLTSDGGDPILVVNATGSAFELPGREIPVQATGKVESFIPGEAEKKYGLKLDQNLYQSYDRKPVIIAQSLALAPRPQDLADAPAGYFDKTIAVSGEVRKISTDTGSGSFALFEDGWVDDVGVLVVGVNRNLEGGVIQEGEQVVVTGKAQQPSVNVLEKNLGWNANKAQEFISQYQNRPIIVAEDVYPSAVPKD